VFNWLQQFLVRRWFLIALTLVLLVALPFGVQLQLLASSKAARNAIVFCVLFLMAWPLDASHMWQALRSPWAVLLAVGVNVGLLPLVAWLVSLGLSRDLAPGLLVAAATPCTLASAAVWTRRAGGDPAVAILVTIITNAGSFLITPVWLSILAPTATSTASSISLTAMIIKLGLLVVLPMVLAQLTRLRPRVAAWATANKTPIGVLALCGILAMVFLGSIQTSMRIWDTSKPALHWFDIAAMIAGVLVVHLSMAATGYWLARLLGIQHKAAVAVLFAGSQKTLMVGLSVCDDLGVIILPMVCYHVGQLLVDTIIADRLRSRDGPPDEKHKDRSNENTT